MVMWFYGWEFRMVSHHPAKFGGHRDCGSGDMMFLVLERKHSACPHFNLPLLFISKGHGLKAHGSNLIISNLGHTRLNQQLEKYLKQIFASSSKKGDKKEN